MPDESSLVAVSSVTRAETAGHLLLLKFEIIRVLRRRTDYYYCCAQSCADSCTQGFALGYYSRTIGHNVTNSLCPGYYCA